MYLCIKVTLAQQEYPKVFIWPLPGHVRELKLFLRQIYSTSKNLIKPRILQGFSGKTLNISILFQYLLSSVLCLIKGICII